MNNSLEFTLEELHKLAARFDWDVYYYEGFNILWIIGDIGADVDTIEDWFGHFIAAMVNLGYEPNIVSSLQSAHVAWVKNDRLQIKISVPKSDIMSGLVRAAIIMFESEEKKGNKE